MPRLSAPRRHGRRAATAVLAILLAGGAANAASTHNFYDATGRFVGSTSEPIAIRSNRYDGGDNRTLWQSLQATAKSSTQQLSNYQVLFQGQALVSGNGAYTLSMQEDGNAVIYNGSTPIWSTCTFLTTGASFDMQGDGNLVLYDAQFVPIWSSQTANNAGATLTMQSDGNLVIYNSSGTAVWASKSNPPKC